MNFPTPDSKWYMAGSQRMGEYIVVAQGPKGRIGYRVIQGGDMVRVRLEPSENEFQLMYGIQKEIENWEKAPMDDGFCRFSVVVDPTILKLALSDGLRAIGEIDEVNPDAPAWARDLTSDPVDGPTENPLAKLPEQFVAGPESNSNTEVLNAVIKLMAEMTNLVGKLLTK